MTFAMRFTEQQPEGVVLREHSRGAASRDGRVWRAAPDAPPQPLAAPTLRAPIARTKARR